MVLLLLLTVYPNYGAVQFNSSPTPTAISPLPAPRASAMPTPSRPVPREEAKLSEIDHWNITIYQANQPDQLEAPELKGPPNSPALTYTVPVVPQPHQDLVETHQFRLKLACIGVLSTIVSSTITAIIVWKGACG